MADTDDNERPLSLNDIGQVKGGRVRDPYGPEPKGAAPPAAPAAAAPLPDLPAPAPVEPAAVEPAGTGMGWLQTQGRMGLRHAADSLDVVPEPDTSAYRRPTPPQEQGHILSPRQASTATSPLEGALAVPVGPAPRQPAPPPPPVEPGSSPIPWITVLSTPGPAQLCPSCKGPLRVLRSSREERLDITWFRLEWLEIERCWADCPKHPTLETVPLQRPTYLVPDSRVGNGLLARVATWRWQDHTPLIDIARLLSDLGLRCSERRVASWLEQGHRFIAPIARALHAKAAGGSRDELGMLLSDGRREGRLRATVKGKAIAFDWSAGGEGPRPDTPDERARRVLLDARGWSYEGRQATLRRSAAQALGSRRDGAARLLWLLEELRGAADGANERALLGRIQALLASERDLDPRMRAAANTLAVHGIEGLCRFDAQGKPAAPPPRPENARAVLPRWFLGISDGPIEAVTDWLTVVESCRESGVPPWRYLRDLFQAASDGPIKAEAWLPDAQR